MALPLACFRSNGADHPLKFALQMLDDPSLGCPESGVRRSLSRRAIHQMFLSGADCGHLWLNHSSAASFRNMNDIFGLPPIHSRSNSRADRLDRPAHRVRVQICIAVRCRGLGMPKKLSNDRQAEGCASTKGCEAVSQIMDAQAIKPSGPRHGGPGLF